MRYLAFMGSLFMLLWSNQSYSQDSATYKLEFDHILLFVSDHTLKDSLDQIFSPAEKLTTRHNTQGTIGYYYLFYNTYIELLYLEDSTKAQLNETDFGSNYAARWSNEEGVNPIAFGMMMAPWDSIMGNTHFHKYQSSDAPEGEYYLMSKANKQLAQPLIYVSKPNRAYDSLESLEEINGKPQEIRKDLRQYLTHKSKVKRLTQLVYTGKPEHEIDGNLALIEEAPMIQLKQAEPTTLTLVFDGKAQKQKVLKLNSHTKLIIQY